MTNEEFSNTFDTMLSSYAHNAQFSEQTSLADVSLDEYEKSVFLTQAQDQIVKTYFERHLNSNGEGFDDSTRRQLDYSNLITTTTITNIKESQEESFSDQGIVLDFSNAVFGTYTDETTGQEYSKAPLFIINERVVTAVKTVDEETGEEEYTNKRSYVIVPINYKDYDRMQARAYNEPLKRQAWRLFETDPSTLSSSVELVLRSDADDFYKYVVRYIRRPRPIVLVDLSDTSNELSIEGVSKITQCELNPIIHNEILQLAVQMALVSKGIETRDMKAAREANKD